MLCRQQIVCVCLLLLGNSRPLLAGEPTPVNYQIDLATAHQGYDGKTCWVHARGGTIPARAPGNPTDVPIVVITSQKLLLTGFDVFYGLHEFRTDDLGETWSGPTEQATLRRRSPKEGVEIVPCDFTPKWHQATGKLLGTGATFWYSTKTNAIIEHSPSEIPYSVYDPEQRTWTEWKTVEMPQEPQFEYARAGCTQRVRFAERRDSVADLLRRADGPAAEFGRHSLPVRRQDAELRRARQPDEVSQGPRLRRAVADEVRRLVLSHAPQRRFRRHHAQPRRTAFRRTNAVEVRRRRGLGQLQHAGPLGHALGRLISRLYPPRPRQRQRLPAPRPLVMAQVDPERMVVLRKTERILVPQRGARLGNFGVNNVSENETWVVVTEWMQTNGPNYIIPVENKCGADNSIYVAKIRWEKPNRPAKTRR